MNRTVALAALFLLAAAADAGAAGVKVGNVQVYEGMCEASGAVAVPEGSFGDHFLILDNEDNILRIYAVGDPGAPPVERDVGRDLNLSSRDRDDIDLEAATWIGHHAVLVGSLGRNKDGDARPARRTMLSVDIAMEGGVTEISAPVGVTQALLPALAALDDSLAAAIGDLDAEVAELSPKENGINLEGMSVSADGLALFLGFRNPVPGGHAMLVKLLNPQDVLFRNAVPAFARPIRLDLKGRGIRSMEYSPAAGAYFIIAGAVDEGAGFDIYRWVEGGDPAPIPGAAEALASLDDFAPEGLIVDPTGKRLQIFSDNNNCVEKLFKSVVLTIE